MSKTPRKILATCALTYANGPLHLGHMVEYIQTDEGRLVHEGGAFNYEYFLKDHLGNIRVRFQATEDGTKLLQETHYYPFGMQLYGLLPEVENQSVISGNRQLFNGKEYMNTFGLNWYDYGARYYDPQVGRWWSVDPKADLAPDWTPYRYALNNPVRFFDPDGMRYRFIDELVD